jgi:hypothetical protein
MDTQFGQNLTEDEEDLISDLAGTFCDQKRMGYKPSICEFLDRLPNERLREEFIEIVNMDRLLTSIERAKAHNEKRPMEHRKMLHRALEH